MKQTRTLRELFSFPGFYAKRHLQGVFGDPKARIVESKRQKKEPYVQVVGKATEDTTTLKFGRYEIWMRLVGASTCDLNKNGYCAAIAVALKWNTSIG